MAKFVLMDAVVKANNVDLSDHVSQVTIEAQGDEVELSAFQNDYKEFGAGLKDATITVDFYQDFAASSVDQTLWAFNESGGTVEVVVKASNAATSSTNPSYTMSSRLFNYAPVSGGVGEASTTTVTFRNAGSAGLTRATA